VNLEANGSAAGVRAQASGHRQLDERRDHSRHGTEDRDRLGERTWPAPR
jgi:hypothetical protein